MAKKKVIVVDDSALIRQIFTEILNSDPSLEVIATAKDPFDARNKIKELNPDVITLDIEMPNMDGLSFLDKIMSLRPMPVVMVSTLTQKGANETLKALEAGAIDYVSKPVANQNKESLSELKSELIAKVKNAASSKVIQFKELSIDGKQINFTPSASTLRKVIAIGSSTGGVEALKVVAMKFPKNCPPIVVTQHMPEQFTASFAKRLDECCQIKVCEARDGQKLEQGSMYIAPGNKHLTVTTIRGVKICQIKDGETVSGHKPSVDVLFNSCAENLTKSDVIGVILTGMGRDGAEGLLNLRKHSCFTIGQCKSSCVVYGMPKAAMEIGAVKKEVHLDKITWEILKHC